MSGPIEIFRTGTHTDMHGATLSFTEADLAAMAKAYDPAVSEAPIVVGHPKADAPAYGWISALSEKRGKLFADVRQVDPVFAEMVRAGRFKKLSASLYSPTSPTNPVPGVWYLRHVGFLGAQPPAVKGLAPVNFAAGDEEGLVTVEFGEDTGFIARLVGLLRGVRDYITEKDGTEKAEAVLPSWTLDSLQEGAAVAMAAPVESPSEQLSYSEEEEMDKKEMAANAERQRNLDAMREAELERREQELARREAAFAESKRLAEAETFVNTIVSEGRLTPAQSAGLADFMAKLTAEDVLEFAEGDGRKKTSPAAFMKAFLSRLPKQVNFSEASAPTGGEEELDPEEAATRAVAFQERRRAAGIVITTTEALAAVKAGKDRE